MDSNPRKNRGVIRRFSHFYFSKTFLWCIVGVGMILHLHQYLFNRSLWVDEASLAMNILDRSYLDLLKPLSFNQNAPVGFLMLEKFLTQWLGESEYVLRLVPIVSALLALIVFAKLAPYFLSPAAVPISLGFLALSDLFIYHSSTLKQYSSDVLITLLLYWGIIEIFSTPATFFQILKLGVIGVVAIWFSHPAVFVLAGVGACFLVQWLINRKWARILQMIPAYLLWIVSFVMLYMVSLRYTTDNEYLNQFWSGGFMPLPPKSVKDGLWFTNKFFEVLGYSLKFPPSFSDILRHFGRIFASALGLSPSIGFSLEEIGKVLFSQTVWLLLYCIAAFTLLAGCASLAVREKKFCLLVSPIFFSLLASGMHTYPFENRLLLFLIPIIFMFLGQGAVWVQDKSKHRAPLVSIVFICVLCIYPIYLTARHLIYPRKHEEARPVVQYLKDHQEAGDIVYLYYASRSVFTYYARLLDIKEDNWIQGIESRKNWNNYIKDLQQLRGRERVWLFFSHAYSEEAFFLSYLDTVGKRLGEFKDFRASVYLYDLRLKQ